jgi:hypothetical protein
VLVVEDDPFIRIVAEEMFLAESRFLSQGVGLKSLRIFGAAKGLSSLQLSRNLGVQVKPAFV